jgi:hypothetical protein
MNEHKTTDASLRMSQEVRELLCDLFQIAMGCELKLRRVLTGVTTHLH